MAQRRLDGLCFNCPEKFSRDHLKHCTGKGIYLLEMSADEDSQDGSESDEDLKISLAAITGIQTSATLHLTARICDTHATALVDSGSTHSFINEALAQRLGLTPDPRVASAGLCKAVQGGAPPHRQGVHSRPLCYPPGQFWDRPWLRLASHSWPYSFGFHQSQHGILAP